MILRHEEVKPLLRKMFFTGQMGMMGTGKMGMFQSAWGCPGNFQDGSTDVCLGTCIWQFSFSVDRRWNEKDACYAVEVGISVLRLKMFALKEFGNRRDWNL